MTDNPNFASQHTPIDPKTIFASEPEAPSTPQLAPNIVPFPATDDAKGGKGGKEVAVSSPPSPASPPFSPPRRENAPSDRPILPRDDGLFRPAPATNPVIAALKQAGLYVEELSARRHAMVCPWTGEHAASDAAHAQYHEPTMLEPHGRFACPTCPNDQRHIGLLLDHLGVDALSARCKPRIRIMAGEMLRILHEAERLLVGLGLYQSGGVIVSLSQSASGDTTATIVNENALTKALAECADWQRYDGRSKAWRPCDPTPQLVKQLLNAQEYAHLPVLEGIARQPYLRKGDGALITTPGYDALSQMYAAFDEEQFSVLPATEEAARQALAELKDLLTEFHFASEADRSAMLGAMLTAASRSSLPLAPAFNITASMSGSGKSYGAMLLAKFAGPSDPYNMSYPTTGEEATKVMLAAFKEKPAAISFDDMQTDWLPHGMMNRMLTSETITDRILGSSRMLQVSTNAFITGTGNNVSPLHDMCRRVVTISLTPRSSTPSTIRYAGKPLDRVTAERGRYVMLALSIIRAWREAGSPRTDIADIATYGAWSDTCRQPLLWLGECDPAQSLIEQVKFDPDAEALGRFMSAWVDLFGNSPVMLRRVIDRAEQQDGDLLDAIRDLPVMDGKFINRGRLGWYLKKKSNRVVSGMHIEGQQSSERKTWSVVGSKPTIARDDCPDDAPDVSAAWRDDSRPTDSPPLIHAPNGDVF